MMVKIVQEKIKVSLNLHDDSLVPSILTSQDGNKIEKRMRIFERR